LAEKEERKEETGIKTSHHGSLTETLFCSGLEDKQKICNKVFMSPYEHDVAKGSLLIFVATFAITIQAYICVPTLSNAF